MMTESLRKVILLTLCILSLFCRTVFAMDIDKIIVFGDSLSDNGNIFSLTSKAHKAKSSVPIIPKEPPYFEGRFSNGSVWIEKLANALNVPLLDYAYAGSWAEPYHDSNLIIPFGLDMQVNFYLVSAALDRDKGRHLYVIWSGGNDYIDGREDVEYATTNAISYIQKQIDWLVYYGAKHFLILNVPDLSSVPYVVSRGPNLGSVVHKLSQLHNKKFAAMIKQVKAANPTIDVATIDIETYFNDIISNPSKYLLKNVTDACYDGFSLKNMLDAQEIKAAKEYDIDIMNSPSLRTAYSASKVASFGQPFCSNPDEYLFWDTIHPTQVVHQMLAKTAYDAINAI